METSLDDTFDGVLGRLFDGLPAEPRLPLARGTTVDRYVVLGTLGMGGMGVVYTAYDPELDRRVALKLIRPGRSHAAAAADADARLLREAQAMARLSHPNVLAVYDVGRYEDEVFVTIELVEGCTLAEWKREHPRTWREVREVFEQAGRGLAAAHAVGLIHRDFKPENVLIGRDGRVRVADFGLARSVTPAPSEPIAAAEGHAASPLAEPLTRAGTLVGTPGYMAPEQIRGEAIGPLADQFSFCAALYAMFYGALPFATRDDLLAGRAGLARPRDGVPSWLHEVVLRGLSAAPAQRFPSMDALLSALRGPARRWLWAGAAAVVVGLAVLLTWLAAGEAPTSPCRSAADQMAGVWSDARAARLREAFVATGLPYAAASAGLVAEKLSLYAQGWIQAHTEACEATHVRGEQSAELLDLRMLCLQQRKGGLESLVDLFLAANPALVRNATSAVSQLAPLASCSDPGALGGGRQPPANGEQERAALVLQRALGRVEALGNAGKLAEWLAAGEEVLAKARALGYAPLLAEALLQVGIAHERLEHPKRAEQILHEAAALAAASGHREVGARAWNELVLTLGFDRADEPRGRQAALHAVGALERLGGGATARGLEAFLHMYLGQMFSYAGKLAPAAEHFEQALALRERLLGRHHAHVAQAVAGLAVVCSMRNELGRAAALLERALSITEREFGERHPSVATSLGNMAIVAMQRGRYAEALAYSERAVKIIEALDPRGGILATLLTGQGNTLAELGRHEEAAAAHRRALAIRERTMGKEHPEYAMVLGNLGGQLVLTGRLAEGLEAQERTVAIFRRRLPPDHPWLGSSQDDLGDAFAALGRFDEALAAHRRALAVNVKANGATHPAVAVSHHGIAQVLLRQKQVALALESYGRALAIREKTLGESHPLTAATLLGMGEARLAKGEAAAAAKLLERAQRILAGTEASPLALGQAGFLLAQALWEGRERSRAREVASSAGATYREAGLRREAAAVETWLASHR